MIESSLNRIAALAAAAALGVGAALGIGGCLGSDEKSRTITTTATGPVPTVATTGTTPADGDKPSICDRYPRICEFGSGKSSSGD